MGYKPGQGLGRDSSGIIAPIEKSLQKGRLGLPATKQPKIERDSDYPSFHSQQKSSTSTTDSEGESPSEGGPDVRRRDRRKRALCDEDEGPKKPVPSYSSFSMKMMVSGYGLNTFLINFKILSVFVNINKNGIAFCKLIYN